MAKQTSVADGGVAALHLAGVLDSSEILYEDDITDDTIPDIQKISKQNNVLSTWGNAMTMNLNSLLLENIVSSAYYKAYLNEVTTFQQIVEEIYYNVQHMEPWERGTRKTTGMTGMCGGVRGVGAGGVVSTAFCLVYKMFTMKLTRKQLVSLINHSDSPYLRGLGFMYIRFCQAPSDLWSWMEPYLDDEEEIDPRSGGGDKITIGQVVKMMLTKLDWYGTLFPRIPVPIQKEIEVKFQQRAQQKMEMDKKMYKKDDSGERSSDRDRYLRSGSRDRDRDRDRIRSRNRDSRDRKRSRSRSKDKDRDKDRNRDRDRDRNRSRRRTAVEDDRSHSRRTADDADRNRDKKHGFYKCKHHLRHHHCKKHKRHCRKHAKISQSNTLMEQLGINLSEKEK